MLEIILAHSLIYLEYLVVKWSSESIVKKNFFFKNSKLI